MKRMLAVEGPQTAYRDPNMAAALSVVAGLGQLYNGETRKAYLFLGATAINMLLLGTLALAIPISNAMLELGKLTHMSPNPALIASLHQAQMGSPASLVLAAAILMFVIYAARDAYDHAQTIKRKTLYPEATMEMTEAASGSYMFHFAIMLTCAILAFFFIIPPQPRTQVTEIEFVEQQTESPVKPKVEKKRSLNNSVAAAAAEVVRQNVDHVKQSAAAQQKTVTHTQTPPKEAQQSEAAKLPTPTPPKPMKSADAPPTPTVTKPAEVRPMPTLNPVAPKTFEAPKPIFTPPTPVTRAPNPMPSPQQLAMAPALPNLPFMPNAPQQSASATPTVTPVAVKTSSALSAVPGPLAVVRSAATGPATTGPSPVAIKTPSADMAAPNIATPGQGKIGTNKGDKDAKTPGPNRVSQYTSNPTSPGGPIVPNVGRGPMIGPAGTTEKGASKNDNTGTAMAPIGTPIGKTADDAVKSPEFGPYMAELQRRIKRAWFPPRAGRTRQVKVHFQISREGMLSHLTIFSSSGDSLTDNAALKAVENAAPFKPLPAGSPSEVDIEFTFDYNVMGGHF